MLNNATTIAPRQSAKTDLKISARTTLLDLYTVRVARGCDAESVRNCVGDATHPGFLRWVFNVAIKRDGGKRELRFWKDEICDTVDKWAAPQLVISKILGTRRSYPRGEIEIQWTINATTISRLVRAGELAEVNRELTRESLAGFLERRLQ